MGPGRRSGGGTVPEERGTVPDDQVPALLPCPLGWELRGAQGRRDPSPCPSGEISEVPQGPWMEASRSHPPCLYLHALPPGCRPVLLWGTLPLPQLSLPPMTRRSPTSLPTSAERQRDPLNPTHLYAPFQKAPPCGGTVATMGSVLLILTPCTRQQGPGD